MRDRHLSDGELLQSIDGELPPDRQPAVEAHLAVCEACTARARQLGEAVAESAESYSEEFARPLSTQARARLESSLEAAALAVDRSRARPAAAARWSAACAAVIAAALLIGSNGRPLPLGVASGPSVVEGRPLPVASMTPGAVRSVRANELCVERHDPAPPPVPPAVARQVLRAYGMENEPPETFELDYLVTPELGGAVDASNLWPQPYQKRMWNAFVKDELERLLPDLVCTGRVSLEVAQRDIATDWIAAYRKYFKTRDPLTTAFGLSRKLS